MFSFTSYFTVNLAWLCVNLGLQWVSSYYKWVHFIVYVSILVHDFFLMCMPPFKMRLYYLSGGPAPLNPEISAALSSATVCGILLFGINVGFCFYFFNMVLHIMLSKIALVICFFIYAVYMFAEEDANAKRKMAAKQK